MSSNSSPIVPLLLAAVTAVGVAVGIQQLGGDGKNATPSEQRAAPPKPRWTATAQGRVEPKGGEIRLSAQAPGRIDNVLVKVNDAVRAGDLLVRIDDSDALARLMGADAEAGVRKRERDTENTNVPRLAQDRRNAEDRLNTTERAIAVARIELDRLMLARQAKPDSVRPEQIAAQRKALEDAQKRLDEDRQALRQAQLAAGVPLPTRLEAGLTASRAELSLAEAALERTRVRAPADATVLQVIAHVGEVAAASPEQPLVVVGDLSALRVRAEVEERDAAKVSPGQAVVLRTDTYVGREFKGRVATIAKAMRSPSLARKGPKRPNDLDTLEVMIDVDQGSPLLPGMRVDVYFAASDGAAEPAKTEQSSAASPAKAPVPAKAAPAGGSVTPASASPAAGAPQVLPPLASEAPKGN